MQAATGFPIDDAFAELSGNCIQETFSSTLPSVTLLGVEILFRIYVDGLENVGSCEKNSFGYLEGIDLKTIFTCIYSAIFSKDNLEVIGILELSWSVSFNHY